MSLRARARRFAAGVRLVVHGPPLLRLIRLLRRGETAGPEYANLCLQVGLAARATAALQQAPVSPAYSSAHVRLASLTGQIDSAIKQTRILAEGLPRATVSRREIEAVVSCVAPLSPETALMLIHAGGHWNSAEPALRLQLGDREGCARRLEELGVLLGPQRWLLWANLHDDPAHQFEGLNRFLAAHGLLAVKARNPAQPLSVCNLEMSEPMARESPTRATLSVVMTCYECAPYVGSAIRSVLEQTHRNLELIVVDDASRDDTWRCVQSAASADVRVRPVRLRQNVGTYAAKNVGLALAKGEYLAFQDADDWSCPERFALCLGLLQRQPWLQAVGCEYVRLQEDGRFWSDLVWPLQRRTPNSVLFRRRVLERIGFFNEHRFGSDGEYVARLQVAFGRHALHRLARPLIIAARRESSLMTAPSTGLDAHGRSQARVDFQEHWTEELLRRALAGKSMYRAARSK